MAVYTKITIEDMAGIFLPVNLENPLRLEPIQAGVENTNYHLFTGNQRFILTIFEQRTNPADLPFFIAMMRHLAGHGLPCPDVLTEQPFLLKGKPAIITSFLQGSPVDTTDPTSCYQAGRLLAAMHLGVDDFTMTRDTTLPPARWRDLIDAYASDADRDFPGMRDILHEEIDAFEKADTEALPRGAIHEDFFVDNVFFQDGRLTGVIDFYFACTGFFVYDLMLAINAWCGTDFEKIMALRRGYESLRLLSDLEKKMMPVFGKAAAIRIVATRLNDWFRTAGHDGVTRKDPLEHYRLLENYRAWDAMRG